MTINLSKIFINLGFIFIGALGALILVLYFYGGLLKYQEIDNVFKTTSQKQYDNSSYNCVNFSQEAVSQLQKEGISSSVIVVEDPDGDGTHAVVSVWFDPQTNNFVPKTEYLGDYQELKTLYGWTNQ